MRSFLRVLPSRYPLAPLCWLGDAKPRRVRCACRGRVNVGHRDADANLRRIEATVRPRAALNRIARVAGDALATAVRLPLAPLIRGIGTRMAAHHLSID